MNLNSILIGSENAQRLKGYYTSLFGEPAMDEDDYSGWQLGTGFIMVGAHDEVKGENPQPGRTIWNIESANVQGDFTRLKAAGAMVIREPYTMDGAPPDSWIATFSDPDGNYFQLVSPM